MIHSAVAEPDSAAAPAPPKRRGRAAGAADGDRVAAPAAYVCLKGLVNRVPFEVGLASWPPCRTPALSASEA